jgi:rod shape-determining protein MreD
MLLQVLLFDQLQLWGVCHPYVYVLCLLMLPITLPHNIDMLIGALAGLIMDVCCNSLGVHISVCVLIMFARPYLVGVLVNDKDRLNEQISIRSLGMEAMVKYVCILVVVHHFLIFLLGAWSWHHIGFVLLATLVSSLITILIILGYNVLRFK